MTKWQGLWIALTHTHRNARQCLYKWVTPVMSAFELCLNKGNCAALPLKWIMMCVFFYWPQRIQSSSAFVLNMQPLNIYTVLLYIHESLAFFCFFAANPSVASYCMCNPWRLCKSLQEDLEPPSSPCTIDSYLPAESILGLPLVYPPFETLQNFSSANLTVFGFGHSGAFQGLFFVVFFFLLHRSVWVERCLLYTLISPCGLLCLSSGQLSITVSTSWQFWANTEKCILSICCVRATPSSPLPAPISCPTNISASLIEPH